MWQDERCGKQALAASIMEGIARSGASRHVAAATAAALWRAATSDPSDYHGLASAEAAHATEAAEISKPNGQKFLSSGSCIGKVLEEVVHEAIQDWSRPVRQQHKACILHVGAILTVSADACHLDAADYDTGPFEFTDFGEPDECE